VSECLYSLAAIYRSFNEDERAEQLLREALAIQRKTVGYRHTNVALTLNFLGIQVLTRGDHAEAEGLQREALEIIRERLGSDHPSIHPYLMGLGSTLSRLNRPEEALPLFQEAEALSRAKQLPTGHLARSLHLKALAMVRMKRYEEAEAAFLEARALFVTDTFRSVYEARNDSLLVDLYERWGRPEQAAALLAPHR
jgi:tetratricopeptide (TPR) repeat protein